MKRLSKIFKICRKNESGLALMELLIAVAITGILMTGIATMVLQVISVKALSANMITATKQVDNAFHYLIRDVQQCNNATDTDPDDPEALVFEWTWVDEDAPYHRIVYEIDEATGGLYRNVTTSESWHGTPVKEQRLLVAKYMDTEKVYWEVSEDGQTVKMTIAATVGGYKSKSETRYIPVTPRLSSPPEEDS